MKFLTSILVAILTVALVSAQFGFGFPRFDYNAFSAEVPTNVRDPRQNRGPVVFPPPPRNAVDESSGVIVGASGYGFVPPQQQSRRRNGRIGAFYYNSVVGPSSAYSGFNLYKSPYTYNYSFL